MKNVSSLAAMVKKNSSLKNQLGVSTGFSNPTTWLSTGNYTLNYLISGNFERGIPLGKVSVFAGDSGAGKSYIVSGNIIRDAQQKGVYVYLFDTENAIDEEWAANLGVKLTDDYIYKGNAALIDDIAKEIATITASYRNDYGHMPKDERPPMLFVIDSLGMTITPTEEEQFKKGDMKGDLGRKAKQLKALITNCVNMFGDLNIGLVATNHTYQSQGTYIPTTVISGGSGFVYASSIIVTMTKSNLKTDDDTKKELKSEGIEAPKYSGIIAKCKVEKSRFNKPFEAVPIEIPYDTGMNPYSGLFDMFLNMGIIKKEGVRYTYVDTDTGETTMMYRKRYEANENGILDTIMEQFFRHPMTPKRGKHINNEDECVIPDEHKALYDEDSEETTSE